ncbi:transposase, partial [Jejuia pallidilutea]
INFIEHLSFNAFNEGTRLRSTIYKAQSLTKVKTKIVGADAIYATNKNRNFVTKNNIRTDFKRKGKLPKNYGQEKKLKALITKERATRLEGSFGKEKEHYHLKKIKAKTKATEKLWIFFGIHTANALEIGRRIQNNQN